MIAGPFVLNTRDLGRRAGSMRELELTISAAEPLGSDVIGIPGGGPLELDVRLESVSEGVLVTGSAHGVAVGECVRCLRKVVQDVDVDFTELFTYGVGRREHNGDEEGQELPKLDGDLLDLEPTLTDAIVPALPFQPVCDPDCAGLCSVCGVRLDDAEPGHAHEQLDPRWAALAGLAEPAGLVEDSGPVESDPDERDR